MQCGIVGSNKRISPGRSGTAKPSVGKQKYDTTTSKNFRKECCGIKPVFGVWAHICGSDLIRDRDGTIYVLEDNLRVPSGVSYMLENRKVTKRVFPELFEDYNIIPMSDYPTNLLDTLSSISPRPMDYPEVVVLTPGIYNIKVKPLHS